MQLGAFCIWGMAKPMSLEIKEVQPFIRYSNTLDDLAVFSEFQSSITKVLILKRKPQEVVGIVAVSIVGFVLGIRMYQTTALGFWIIPFDTILLPGLLLLLNKLLTNSFIKLARKNMIKCYEQSGDKFFIGEHMLSVDENGILGVSKYSETRLAWGAIDKIESEKDYTYIYITEVSAIIIPHQNITEGDLPALLQAIKTHYKPDQQFIV